MYCSYDTDDLFSNFDQDEEQEDEDGMSNQICKAGSAFCSCCPCMKTGANKVGVTDEQEKPNDQDNEEKPPEE